MAAVAETISNPGSEKQKINKSSFLTIVVEDKPFAMTPQTQEYRIWRERFKTTRGTIENFEMSDWGEYVFERYNLALSELTKVIVDTPRRGYLQLGSERIRMRIPVSLAEYFKRV